MLEVAVNTGPSYLEQAQIALTAAAASDWVCADYVRIDGTTGSCTNFLGTSFTVVPSGAFFGGLVGPFLTALPNFGLRDPLGVTAIRGSFPSCSAYQCDLFWGYILGGSGAFQKGSSAFVEATVVAPVGATVTLIIVQQ